MTREEAMIHWMEKMNHIWFNKPKNRADYFNETFNPRFFWIYYHKGQSPVTLHISMFS